MNANSFIQTYIFLLSPNQTNIHDRIKTKVQSNSDTPAQTNNGPRKVVKILEKDEAKLQKASEDIKNEANNEDEGLLKDLTEEKKKQRCRYYPQCKNEKTCPFVHPTEPCTFFPTCKFGNQCLNKHPECKFGKTCTRPNCFYEHPFPKKQVSDPLTQLLSMINSGGKRKPMGLGMGFGMSRPHVKKPYNPANANAGASTANPTEDKQEEQQQQQASE